MGRHARCGRRLPLPTDTSQGGYRHVALNASSWVPGFRARPGNRIQRHHVSRTRGRCVAGQLGSAGPELAEKGRTSAQARSLQRRVCLVIRAIRHQFEKAQEWPMPACRVVSRTIARNHCSLHASLAAGRRRSVRRVPRLSGFASGDRLFMPRLHCTFGRGGSPGRFVLSLG